MADFMERARDAVTALGWVDTVSLSVLLVFLIRGLLHGFVWQVAALLGVVGGLLAARNLAPELAPLIRDWFPSLAEDGSLDMVAAYFSVFALVVVAAALVGKLLRGLIDQLKLGSFDRLLGGVFGVLKASALLVIGVSFLSLFEPVGDVLAQSKTARYSGKAIERSGPFFPAEVKVHLGEAFASLNEVLSDAPESGSEPDAEPVLLQEGDQVERPPDVLERLDEILRDGQVDSEQGSAEDG